MDSECPGLPPRGKGHGLPRAWHRAPLCALKFLPLPPASPTPPSNSAPQCRRTEHHVGESEKSPFRRVKPTSVDDNHHGNNTRPTQERGRSGLCPVSSTKLGLRASANGQTQEVTFLVGFEGRIGVHHREEERHIPRGGHSAGRGPEVGRCSGCSAVEEVKAPPS